MPPKKIIKKSPVKASKKTTKKITKKTAKKSTKKTTKNEAAVKNLDMDKFVSIPVENHEENEENWRKLLKEIENSEKKRQIKELCEKIQAAFDREIPKCKEDIEKLQSRESLGVPTIGKLFDFHDIQMKTLKQQFLEERKLILDDFETLLLIPDATESLVKKNAELKEQIGAENQNQSNKLEATVEKIHQEWKTVDEDLPKNAAKQSDCLLETTSSLSSAFERSSERAEKLSYVAKSEMKWVEVKEIINSRRKKEFFLIVLREHFKKLKEKSHKKLNPLQEKRTALRSEVNAIRDLLDKKSTAERKRLEDLTVISTQEIENMTKGLNRGKKLCKLLANILKINTDFAKVPPEKASLVARTSEIAADIVFLKQTKEELLCENRKLCQCLKNYCDNKIIDM